MADSKINGEIKSIADAIRIIKRLSKTKFVSDGWPFHKFAFGIWFRGQAEIGLQLEPHVFREIRIKGSKRSKAKVIHYDETNLFEHLKLRVPSYQQTYRSAFDWLCLMQHYSLPTRLLDWSESILAALYFAVREKPEEDGEIIVLNARRLNGITKKRPTISTSSNAGVVIRAE